jgi:hypothetical protein
MTWLRRRRLQQTGGRRIAEIGITGRWRGGSIASGRIWNDSEGAWRAPHEGRDVIVKTIAQRVGIVDCL